MAIPDTETELDFITQRLTGLADAQDFFIAGSAFPDRNSHFSYIVENTISFATIEDLVNLPPSYSPVQTGDEDTEYKEL